MTKKMLFAEPDKKNQMNGAKGVHFQFSGGEIMQKVRKITLKITENGKSCLKTIESNRRRVFVMLGQLCTVFLSIPFWLQIVCHIF